MYPWDTDTPLMQNSQILTNKAKMTYFDEQRTIPPECMMRYKPLSNLKKTLQY